MSLDACRGLCLVKAEAEVIFHGPTRKIVIKKVNEIDLPLESRHKDLNLNVETKFGVDVLSFQGYKILCYGRPSWCDFKSEETQKVIRSFIHTHQPIIGYCDDTCVAVIISTDSEFSARGNWMSEYHNFMEGHKRISHEEGYIAIN